MERELFTHTGWDMAGDWGDTQFYNCTLVQDIGDLKAGQVFSVVTILMGSGLIQFWNERSDEVLREYKLSYKVHAEAA